MRKSIVTVILLASAASAIAQTAPRAATSAASTPAPATKDANKPQIGDFGIDMAGRDTSVKPGTDFFDYTNGGGVKATPIPADRSS